MSTENSEDVYYHNVFECQHCEYWEVINADDCRWHMEAEHIGDGDTDEQYGLYICPDCKAEGWSQRVVAYRVGPHRVGPQNLVRIKGSFFNRLSTTQTHGG